MSLIGAEFWSALEEFAARPGLRLLARCRGLVAQLAEHAQYKLLAIALCQVQSQPALDLKNSSFIGLLYAYAHSGREIPSRLALGRFIKDAQEISTYTLAHCVPVLPSYPLLTLTYRSFIYTMFSITCNMCRSCMLTDYFVSCEPG